MPSTTDTLCWITLFTYFGALTRMVLSYLTPLFNGLLLPNFIASFFLANIHGSFVMGFFVPFDQLFSPNYIPLYKGITTGYCGSCTTFSTWQRVTAEQLINGRVADGFMSLLLTFCTSYMALISGKHIGEDFIKRRRRIHAPTNAVDQPNTPEMLGVSRYDLLQNSLSRYKILLLATVLVTGVIWAGIVLDTDAEYRRKWWVATALGPIGSLTRYWMLLYNRKRPSFPLFTFLVNVCASVISTVIFVIYLRHTYANSLRYSDEDKNDQWLNVYDFWLNFGVGAGILGCVSTVSTFVNELRKLADENILYAYRYGLLSVVITQILCILIACAKFV